MAFPRAQRAFQSLNNSLSLLAYGIEEGGANAPIEHIRGLLTNSDVISIQPFDQIEHTDNAVMGLVRSNRSAVDQIPPATVVLQCLDSDAQNFPQLSMRPSHSRLIQGVVSKQTLGGVLEDFGQAERYEIGTSIPLIALADLKHPLSQAMVGLDVASKLSEHISTTVPEAESLLPDQRTLKVGIAAINATVLVANLLGREDASGRTADWYNSWAQHYADVQHGVVDKQTAVPLEDTLLAEACAVEPLTKQVVAMQLSVLGTARYAQQSGRSVDEAAMAIGKWFK